MSRTLFQTASVQLPDIDGEFLAAALLVDECQIAEALTEQCGHKTFQISELWRITGNPECKGFVYGANHGGGQRLDTYSSYRE